MPDDASLDDFLDAGNDQQADTEDGDSAPAANDVDSTADVSETLPDADDATDTAEATDADDATERAAESVEPATATYDWTPGGAACEACADVVERRWRDDPGFVCEGCKDW